MWGEEMSDGLVWCDGSYYIDDFIKFVYIRNVEILMFMKRMTQHTPDAPYKIILHHVL